MNDYEKSPELIAWTVWVLAATELAKSSGFGTIRIKGSSVPAVPNVLLSLDKLQV